MMSDNAVIAPKGLDAFGEWFNEVMRLWSSQWQVWVVQGLIVFAICVVPQLLFSVVEMIGTFGSIAASRTPETPEIFGAFKAAQLSVNIVTGLLAAMFYPGMIKTALKQMRGEPIFVSDLFSAMRYGWGTIAVYFLTGLGILACCVGMFALMGLLYLAIPLMVDRDLSTGKAISISWNSTKTNFWLYLLFGIVMGLLSSAGVVACYIGIIATLPFQFIGIAVAYERTFNPTHLVAEPGVPTGYIPPPYTPSPPPIDPNP